MSRVITVSCCADCPSNRRDWHGPDFEYYGDGCSLANKATSEEEMNSFPAWCPLPESGKKEESK